MLEGKGGVNRFLEIFLKERGCLWCEGIVLEWIGRVNRFLKKFRKKFRRRNAHALARAAYSKGIWIASARQKQEWGEGAGTLQRQGKKPILLPFQKNPYKSGNYTHYTLNFFDYTQISKFFPYKSRDYTITLITL